MKKMSKHRLGTILGSLLAISSPLWGVGMCIALDAGCKKKGKCFHVASLAIRKAKAEYRCSKVHHVSGDGWFSALVELDVCGTKRWYKCGTWCEECSLECREIKPKKETDRQ